MRGSARLRKQVNSVGVPSSLIVSKTGSKLTKMTLATSATVLLLTKTRYLSELISEQKV